MRAKTITIRIHRDIRDELDRIATLHHRSLGDTVRGVLYASTLMLDPLLPIPVKATRHAKVSFQWSQALYDDAHDTAAALEISMEELLNRWLWTGLGFRKEASA